MSFSNSLAKIQNEPQMISISLEVVHLMNEMIVAINNKVVSTELAKELLTLLFGPQQQQRFLKLINNKKMRSLLPSDYRVTPATLINTTYNVIEQINKIKSKLPSEFNLSYLPPKQQLENLINKNNNNNNNNNNSNNNINNNTQSKTTTTQTSSSSQPNNTKPTQPQQQNKQAPQQQNNKSTPTTQQNKPVAHPQQQQQQNGKQATPQQQQNKPAAPPQQQNKPAAPPQQQNKPAAPPQQQNKPAAPPQQQNKPAATPQQNGTQTTNGKNEQPQNQQPQQNQQQLPRSTTPPPVVLTPEQQKIQTTIQNHFNALAVSFKHNLITESVMFEHLQRIFGDGAKNYVDKVKLIDNAKVPALPSSFKVDLILENTKNVQEMAVTFRQSLARTQNKN